MSAEYKSSVHIRKAKSCDISDILEITSQAFIDYRKKCGALKLDALEETADDIKRDIENKLVFVAIYEDTVVGCVRVELFDDDSAYLTRFAVKTDIQNKGIGKLLMSAVNEAMSERNTKFLRLHTGYEISLLMKFYTSLGFETELVENSRGYARALLVKKY